MQAAPIFNPSDIHNEGEQISAKIWELLRRNERFRDQVRRLQRLDERVKAERQASGLSNGEIWARSFKLLETVAERHPFAGSALQWLVPEPIFHVRRVTYPLGTKWRKKPVFAPRVIEGGEGTILRMEDQIHWRWWTNKRQENLHGHPIRRGPEIFWTTSPKRKLRNKVNPILEWEHYKWPFTADHSWKDAPEQFKREFQYIWRRAHDARAKNPITGTRIDAPFPHETRFFQGWELADFCPSPSNDLKATKHALVKIIEFQDLAEHYRMFAIPKTILTKGGANEMGQWLAEELKKGSDVFGRLLKDGLLNDAELLGTVQEWNDWLSPRTRRKNTPSRDTHFYRRKRYLDKLVAQIYPEFNVETLLARPLHRARGKEYIPKVGK